MKTVEEKAKAYDEALVKVGKCPTDKYGTLIGMKPTDIFPELRESEEDEDLINYVCSVLTDNFNENDKFDDKHPCIGAIVDKLKSLSPKAHWKPTERQMIALDNAIHSWGCRCGTDPLYPVVVELREQLKAL